MFEGAPIPVNWEGFLRSNANKDELFRYLSDCMHACETDRKVFIGTKDETIVSTQNDVMDVEYLQPCSHEEADNAHSAPRCELCTTRTSQIGNPNRGHRCGCPCNRAFHGASA